MELEQCLFCGNTKDFSVLTSEEEIGLHVHCNYCGASGPVRSKRSEAIAKWNQRAQLAALQADADAFRETLVDNEAYCASLDVTLANFVAENKRLREVIEAVEWVTDGEEWSHCPWCDGLERLNYAGANKEFLARVNEGRGHAPNCPRQLALVSGVTDVTGEDGK